MRKHLHQIGDGVIIALAIIFSFSFLLTAIGKLISGESVMVIVWLSLFILTIAYVLKKVRRKTKK